MIMLARTHFLDWRYYLDLFSLDFYSVFQALYDGLQLNERGKHEMVSNSNKNVIFYLYNKKSVQLLNTQTLGISYLQQLFYWLYQVQINRLNTHIQIIMCTSYRKYKKLGRLMALCLISRKFSQHKCPFCSVNQTEQCIN